ncbi:unnamed protein product [Caenorhabditis brenneri]
MFSFQLQPSDVISWKKMGIQGFYWIENAEASFPWLISQSFSVKRANLGNNFASEIKYQCRKSNCYDVEANDIDFTSSKPVKLL